MKAAVIGNGNMDRSGAHVAARLPMPEEERRAFDASAEVLSAATAQVWERRE